MERLYEVFRRSSSVVIDSRKAVRGTLFFAFEGEQTDGHRYVDDVLALEDTHCVIDNADYQRGTRTILVDNTLEALQKLARMYRDTFDVPVLAITGSNGKTTTKELIMSVLSSDYDIHYTKGNLNNHIGVPLTLLEAAHDCPLMIIEMGANKMGDIEELCGIANPTHGLITNIGTAHIEGFGSQENILIGKTELYRHLAGVNGCIFVNKYDDKLISKLPDNIELQIYPDEQYKVTSNGLYLEIIDQESKERYDCSLYGLYNAMNIHAALSVADYFDVDPEQALASISEYKPSMNRSQVIHLPHDLSIIMDAYNANPTSMEASIRSLDKYNGDKSRVLIIGDMLELGQDELAWHSKILALIQEGKWNKVILVGPLFQAADKSGHFEHYTSVDALLDTMKDNRGQFESSIVLVKASRSMRLERILELFDAEQA